MKWNSRASQSSKRYSRKRHTQSRPDHVQIRCQTGNTGRDQTLESGIDDAVEAREDVEACDTVDSHPGPRYDHHAEKNWHDDIEWSKFIGEERRNNASRYAVDKSALWFVIVSYKGAYPTPLIMMTRVVDAVYGRPSSMP